MPIRPAWYISIFLVILAVGASPSRASDSDWNTNYSTDGTVWAVADSAAAIYIGGDFTTVNGVAANRIARYDKASHLWSAMGGGVNSTVRALAIVGTDLYVGGFFTTVDGVATNHIARWNGSSWSKLGSGTDNAVFALAANGSSLYVGGAFVTAGGITTNQIAKWDGTAWSTLGVGVDSDVYALAMLGTDLYVGGHFSRAGGSDAHFVAKWTGTAWSPIDGLDSLVYSLQVSGTTLYAAGTFDHGVARLSGTQWSLLGTAITGQFRDGAVYALAIKGGYIYAGGSSLSLSVSPYTNLNSIAKWDGTKWSGLEGGTDGTVRALCAIGNSLYVGGGFSKVSNVSSPNLATYSIGPPSILSVNCNGNARGVVGAPVLIGGTRLSSATNVSFNGTSAQFVVRTNSEILAFPASGNSSGKVTVTTPDGVATSAQTFALTGDLNGTGGVVAWGSNTAGQSQVPSSATTGVVGIAAGATHSLALKSDGTIVAWGNNDSSETTVPAWASGEAAISAGNGFSVALSGNGTVGAWGNDDSGQTDVPSGLYDVVAIAAGASHCLALKSDGTVVAWGSNASGQTSVPANLTGVVAIAAGSQHSLALKSDGSIVGWGSNDYGESNSFLGLTGMTAISGGNFESLVLDGTGSVNRYGGIGAGPPSSTNSGVVAISSGDSGNNLALKSDGTVIGWGTNNSGQSTVASGLRALAIANGASHSLALANAPETLAVSLSSNTPKTNDVLTATFAATPAGPKYSYSFTWTKTTGTVVKTISTKTITATSTSLSLSSLGMGDKGDLIRITVTATDPSTSFTTSPASAAVTVINSPPVISTSTLSDGSQNTFYGPVQLVASDADNDALTWSVLSGTLPTGLSLSSSGVLSGTPTGSGISNFTVAVSDGDAPAVTKALSLNVAASLTLSVSDVSLYEGNSGSNPANFLVTLSGVSTQAITVNYATSDGTATSGSTATAGSDYTAANSTLTIPAGQTSATIPVAVLGDLMLEPDETFTLTLSNPDGTGFMGGGASISATGTIKNDDNPPVMTVVGITKAEGQSGTTAFVFKVDLSAPSASAVTVNYVTANGTATAGSDYTATNSTLTIPAGSTSGTITVNVNGDTTVEPDETFTLTLSSPTGGAVFQGGASSISATGTIVNDDADVTPVASNVTGQIQVFKSGLSRNKKTGRYVMSLIVQNTGADLNGPLYLTFDGLLPGVDLYSPDGYTSRATPLGSPYRTLVLPGVDATHPNGVLASGTSISLTVEFVNPNNAGLDFTNRVLQGPGSP